MEIRRLQPEDAEAYREVRRRALEDHPEAFGADLEKHMSLTIEELRQQIAQRVLYGAFQDGQLVATSGAWREASQKMQHRAYIVGIYVSPEKRRQGLGKQIVQAAVDHVRREWPEVEQAVLAVSIGNDAAKTLYESLGFRQYAIDPKVLKVGDTYYDEAMMMLTLH